MHTYLTIFIRIHCWQELFYEKQAKKKKEPKPASRILFNREFFRRIFLFYVELFFGAPNTVSVKIFSGVESEEDRALVD